MKIMAKKITLAVIFIVGMILVFMVLNRKKIIDPKEILKYSWVA
jgi:hypothetical protein